MTDIRHKRGDTFFAHCTYADDADKPLPLIGITVTSAVRSISGILKALTVTPANQATKPGEFDVVATAAETASWPAGPLSWDVQYEEAGYVFSSETHRILVVEDVTP